MGSAVEVKPSQPFESPTTIPPLHKVLNVIAHALPSNPLGLTRHIEAEPPFKASKERWIPLFAEAPSDSRNIASLTQSLNRFDDKTSTKALVTQRHSQPKELSLLKGRNASTASASTTLRQKKDPQEATKPTHALSVAKAGMVVVEEASFPSCGISSLNLSALWSPLIRNASQAIWLKVGMMDSGLGEQFDVPRKSLRRYLSSIQQAHRHYSSLVSSRLVWWHPRGTLVIKQSRANLFRLVSCVKRRHHGLLNRFAPIRHSTSVLGQSQTGRARISQLAKLRSDEILTAVTSQMQQVAQSSPLRLSAVQSVSSRAVRRYTCRARSISRMLKHKYSSASGTEFTKPSRPRTILSKLKEHLGC